ncbi:MAG: SDR family NAD(P)-dependent oxidoreductase [Chloroflexi bacterium]|nr:MAG: SDR family NAD(P)-dependent oxidoreductase [Chloroflexota bacterium]
MRIDGCRTLLTGATGGLGQAMARALAARGARLVLTGRRAEVLEPLAHDLGAEALSVDLADRAALDQLLARCDGVDILVANAALPGTGRLDELTAAQVDRVLDVNLRAPIKLAHSLAAPMRRRGSGHLLFVSSVSGLTASPQASMYCATKFGLRGFALALREELRESGVGVSVIYPGPIRESGMFADTGIQLPPMVGTNSPQEVAAAVVSAIERNRGEITVAPPLMRAGIPLAKLAPRVSAGVQRMFGGDRISAELARAQRHKN